MQYIRYTSEYILKLQLHQHSLLTRKVFFQQNLLAQVFFSVSSGSSSSLCHLQSHLYLQVIFTGFGSSLDLDHHGTSPLDLDHLLILINITGLDLDHHSIWIISLDRIWIITRSGSLGVIITGSGS